MNYGLGNNYNVAFLGVLLIAISMLFQPSFTLDLSQILNAESTEVVTELFDGFYPPINKPIDVFFDRTIRYPDRHRIYICVWCVDAMTHSFRGDRVSFEFAWHCFYKNRSTRNDHIYHIHGPDKTDGHLASNTACICKRKVPLAILKPLANATRVGYGNYMGHFFTQHFDKKGFVHDIGTTLTMQLPSQEALDYLKQDNSLYQKCHNSLYCSIPFSILQEEHFDTHNLYTRVYEIKDYIQSKVLKTTKKSRKNIQTFAQLLEVESE